MIGFREAGGLLVALGGLILVSFALFDGKLVNALFWFLCTLCVLWVVLLGSIETIFSQEYLAVAGLVGMVGLVGVFRYSNLTDIDLQRAYAGATKDMALLTETCRPITPQLSRLAEQGMMACAGEHLNDLSQTTFEATKGVHLGPGLSMIDGAAQLASEAKINRCARAFKTALELCPHSFLSVDDEGRAALLQAAASDTATAERAIEH